MIIKHTSPILTRTLATAAVVSTLATAPAKAQSYYEFEIIAREGDTVGGLEVSGISAALINENGDIAFSGSSGSRSSRVSAVWSTTDVLLVEGQSLGGVTLPDFSQSTFAFNDAGQAAVASDGFGLDGVFTSTGTAITAGSDVGGNIISGNFDRNPALADDGTLFFTADVGTTTTVFRGTDVLAQEGDVIGGVTLTDIGSANTDGVFGIDGAGNAVFFNNLGFGAPGPTAVVSTAGFAIEEDSPFPSGPLAGQNVDLITGPSFGLGVNTQGDVAFRAIVDGVRGIYTQDGLLIANGMIDGIDGAFFGATDLNDNGSFVSFFEDSVVFNDAIVLDGQILITENDTIEGFDIDFLTGFGGLDLNNQGDFVFTPVLFDPNTDEFFSAVVRATLIPEPTSLALLGLGGLLLTRRRPSVRVNA